MWSYKSFHIYIPFIVISWVSKLFSSLTSRHLFLITQVLITFLTYFMDIIFCKKLVCFSLGIYLYRKSHHSMLQCNVFIIISTSSNHLKMFISFDLIYSSVKNAIIQNIVCTWSKIIPTVVKSTTLNKHGDKVKS